MADAPAKQLSPHNKKHQEVRARIIAAHPELRELYGAQPLQLIAVLLLFFARWGLAWALRDAPILLIGLLASTVGVWIVHAAGTYGHESAHRLIIRQERFAFFVDLLIEATMTSFGRLVGYQYRHVNFHHLYLGEYEWDSEMRDLCAHVAVVRAEDVSYVMSRALLALEAALALMPFGGLFAQDVSELLRGKFLLPRSTPADEVRKRRFALPPHLQRKQDIFAVFSLLCYLMAWALWGWRASLFAVWSLSVKASRFDVVGWGQDMAEHNADDPKRPTNSTYTLWNLLFCNTGYHAEHHTFPNVPGCYLPRITAAAPEEFAAVENKTSWAALWLSWLGSGFKSFRITEHQRKLAAAGRCDRLSKAD